MKNKSVLKEIKTLTDQAFGIAGKPENSNFPKLSSTQLLIMDYILEHQGEAILQKDLEDVLKLTRATVSSVLGTLEKYNIIERAIADKDTRTKKIVLTSKAKEFYDYGKEKMIKLESQVTEGITKEESEVFFKVVEKMKNNLERMRKC